MPPSDVIIKDNYSFSPECRGSWICRGREVGLSGKGGMDAETLRACGECGCVYLQAVGGAAALTAACVKRVNGVHFLDEWGAAEACWEFEMEDFPCVVAMDSHGVSLFDAVARQSSLIHRRLS